MQKKKYKKYYLLCFILALTACAKFVSVSDKEDYYAESISSDSQKKSFKIIFSHNINGETHPCGCRHFPLGGLPQVMGALSSEEKDAHLIYIDTGDSFFPTTTVPTFNLKSQTFVANQIADSFDALKLKFFVPGDQDFSLGEEFLETISYNHQFKFLISNSKSDLKIKHIKVGRIFSNKNTYYFIGLVDPLMLSPEIGHKFSDPELSLKLILEKIDKDKNTKIILLSHLGINKDTEIAKKFSEIDWIVGAHTQNFTQQPIVENKTKIVQVLSKNHYLGKIEFPYSSQIENFSLIEIRDDLKDKVSPNSMISFIDDHKLKLNQIFIEEQNAMVNKQPTANKAETFNNCIQCHEAQGNFWQSTPHSLAFGTLTNAKSDNNPECIECHSLKFGEQDGFHSSKKDMIISRNKKFNSQNYLAKYSELFSTIKSVRALSKEQRKSVSKEIKKLNGKFDVRFNYASVQCLNCHDKSSGHPFDNQPTQFHAPKIHGIKNKCLNCHTQDQSPEWFQNKKLNETVFNNHLKNMSCPKGSQ